MSIFLVLEPELKPLGAHRVVEPLAELAGKRRLVEAGASLLELMHCTRRGVDMGAS
jgi:hypothetical protein